MKLLVFLIPIVAVKCTSLLETQPHENEHQPQEHPMPQIPAEILKSSAEHEAEHMLESPPAKKKFYAWAGKRADEEPAPEFYYPAEDKRKFYAWAGKRNQPEMEYESDPLAQDLQKRKFYAWAGKRDDQANYQMPKNYEEEPWNVDKRKFYAWAGKRADHINYPSEMDLSDMEKRKFYAWAGKRAAADFQYQNSPYYGEPENDMEKRKFYAWAGKRADEGFKSEDEKKKFYAWAGKK